MGERPHGRRAEFRLRDKLHPLDDETRRFLLDLADTADSVTIPCGRPVHGYTGRKRPRPQPKSPAR